MTTEELEQFEKLFFQHVHLEMCGEKCYFFRKVNGMDMYPGIIPLGTQDEDGEAILMDADQRDLPHPLGAVAADTDRRITGYCLRAGGSELALYSMRFDNSRDWKTYVLQSLGVIE